MPTIRSDAYGGMQNAKVLAGIEQVPLSLGPVPLGEIARIISQPAELLRRKVGPDAPVFDAPLVEKLQADFAGEKDALPLLAFVVRRLIFENLHERVVGLSQARASGGLGHAIEAEAELAFCEAGFHQSDAARREALRSLFIPRLVRVNRESRLPQRNVALQRQIPAELRSLAPSMTAHRLLVARATLASEENQLDNLDGKQIGHRKLRI